MHDRAQREDLVVVARSTSSRRRRAYFDVRGTARCRSRPALLKTRRGTRVTLVFWPVGDASSHHQRRRRRGAVDPATTSVLARRERQRSAPLRLRRQAVDGDADGLQNPPCIESLGDPLQHLVDAIQPAHAI